MSNTRYASDDSEIAQERYLSSPEHVEMRGVAGNAVAAKAELMLCDSARSLLFFLQGMSIRPKGGGLKQLAVEILQRFPGRIGTPTMHKVGIVKGRNYDANAAREIESELGLRFDTSILEFLLDESKDFKATPSKPMPVDVAVAHCRRRLEADLPDVLLRLCIDPKMRVHAPETNDFTTAVGEAQEEHIRDRTGSSAFTDPAHVCFHDLLGALYEYQKQVRQDALGSVAKTTTANQIWRNLNHCLATGSIVVLEGDTRIGKTTPAEAWCKANLGEARFVSLVGVTSKTSFFRRIARAYGIASGLGRSSTDTQSRDEDFLHRSRMMVVIDQAQNAWPQGKRIYARPELIDWINTALFNHKVPVALIATPQFTERLHCAETQTGWRANQLRGRISRCVKFGPKPSGADVLLVIRHLLPTASEELVDAIVEHAYQKAIPLSSAENLIDEARLIAKEHGRMEIRLSDVSEALTSVVLESEKAMSTIKPKDTKGRQGKSAEVQAECNGVAMPFQRELPRPPSRGNLPMHADSDAERNALEVV